MIYGSDIWLQGGLAAALLLAGLVAVLMKRNAAKHNSQLVEKLQAGESTRLMALAYQGQGKLDAAWQKFQEAPPANLLDDDLYYLALDFEKAGEPKKVIAVLKVLESRKPGHRDAAEVAAKARQNLVLAKAASAKPAEPAAEPQPSGPRFGSFQAHGALGKGAFGIVYRGADVSLGREVAIKALPLAQEFDGESLDKAKAMLFGEVRRAGALSHPSVVTIYDAGEERGECYIAMELMRGADLTAYISSDKRLPADKAIELSARVAEALDYAHREGVVHYDLRPGNIRYDTLADSVKVTDFGIARVTAELKTRSGVKIGLDAYAAPELRSGGPVDSRADLYSLGATLHELLTGRLPTGDAVDTALPAPLASVLKRALAAKPDERFSSGAEMSGALLAAAAQSTETAAVDISL